MNILIIDDEKTISDFFQKVAQARGYTDIDTAISAEEALTHIIRRNYDLITLDIHMPGTSGLDAIAMLRNLCSHAIIAIISGYIPDKISSEVAGCVDVIIPKPVSTDTFSQLLNGTEGMCEIMGTIRSLGITPAGIR